MKNKRQEKLFKKYLKSNISISENEALEDWIGSSSCNEWLEEEWQQASPILNSFGTDRQQAILTQIEAKLNIPSAESKRKNTRALYYINTLKLVAVVLLVFGASFASYKYALQSKPSAEVLETVISVGRGEKANIQLPDGSVVWLNAATTLAYNTNFNTSNRVVTLDGEGFFEVVKSDTPFIVQTKSLDIKVHGTKFNINTYNPSVSKVSLLEGSVEILGSVNKAKVLQPDETYSWNIDQGCYKIESGTVKNDVGWKFNRILFENETLATIMRNMERAFNLDIEIADNRLKERRFTGIFTQNETAEQLFEVMALAKKFNYTVVGNKVKIYQ